MKDLFFYCLIGVLNTCIGFGVIFVLIFFGFLPELANFLGYCIGVVYSFFLNNMITFSQNKIDKKYGLFRFVLSMGIAYLANFMTLFVSYRILRIDVYLSQILAGVSYTLCGFLMSRFFVWNKRR